MTSERETPRRAGSCNHSCPGTLAKIFKFGADANRWYVLGDPKHTASFHFRTFLTNVLFITFANYSGCREQA